MDFVTLVELVYISLVSYKCLSDDYTNSLLPKKNSLEKLDFPFLILRYILVLDILLLPPYKVVTPPPVVETHDVSPANVVPDGVRRKVNKK